MEAKIENGKLILSFPLNNPPTPSSTGKTLLVAGTRGPTATTATVDGKVVTVNVNAYIANK